VSAAIANAAIMNVHQRRRVKTLMVQRHPRRDLPPQITPRRLGGLPVGKIMQGLQHQNRRRDRRPPPPRREQILKLPIGEHIPAMSSEKREHAALRYQMPDQRPRVQQLPIHPLHTLHQHILPAQHHNPGRHADCSAAS
jgi:hypothetical protein